EDICKTGGFSSPDGRYRRSDPVCCTETASVWKSLFHRMSCHCDSGGRTGLFCSDHRTESLYGRGAADSAERKSDHKTCEKTSFIIKTDKSVLNKIKNDFTEVRIILEL